ncbi:MAG TPA: hypothetical protein VGT40_12980 [Methylomirabilota bacterium]|jgi:hypothetical protein|nr:hypothetical protein [Methylomirabilota bacterium]
MAVSRKTSVVESYEEAATWPVSWSAIWVGALAALAVALIFGLLGISLGAYRLGSAASWHELQLPALIFSVCGAFFSFVVGGWAAGKILGARRAEASILHAAIAWLVAVPLLVMLCSLGAAGFFGSWYAGLAGTPVWATANAAADPRAAEVARHAALGALSALLVGLVGAIIGGWMASGEPMTLTYYRTRAALAGNTE